MSNHKNQEIARLDEQIKEIESLSPNTRDEKSLTDDEFQGICTKYGVKKVYNYGKSWYGEAKVFLLNKNGAIYTNENGFSSHHENANEAFIRARGFVTYRYGLTRLMGL
jgi:hypothetical protein